MEKKKFSLGDDFDGNDFQEIKQEVLLRGYLMKKNWFGISQIRMFKLYNTGEIMYYKDAE